MEVLKVGVLDAQSKSFPLWEKPGVWITSQSYYHYTKDEVYGKSATIFPIIYLCAFPYLPDVQESLR